MEHMKTYENPSTGKLSRAINYGETYLGPILLPNTEATVTFKGWEGRDVREVNMTSSQGL